MYSTSEGAKKPLVGLKDKNTMYLGVKIYTAVKVM